MQSTIIVLLLCIKLLSTCKGVATFQCKGPKDCPPNTYCEHQSGQYGQTCQCVTGFVRVNGNCMPELRRNQLCVDDTQCSHLGLVCYRSRCDCAKGLKRADGSCLRVIHPHMASEPTPPMHLQAIWNTSHRVEREKKRSIPPERGGYAGPIAICALIFVSFSILIIVTSYNFRMRNRRLEEVRSILDAHATHSASAPNARRASIGSIRDAPPSYNTLSPPSYEQATGQSPARIITPLRSPSYSLSIETAPVLVSSLATADGSAHCAVSSDASPSNQNTSPSHAPSEGESLMRDRY